MKYLLLLAGLVVGNYAWQVCQPEPHWWSAFERSFFQSFAVLCCYLIREKPPGEVYEIGD